MMHAKHGRVGAFAAVVLGAGVAACAADGLSSFDGGDGPNKATGQDAGGTATPSEAGDRGAAIASGVVLVHAAAFPSFRLCFENLPNLPPQPDSKVMPAANVVGVEIGSLVRIDPLVAPGKVYVIDESTVRGAPGEEDAVPCGELIGQPKTTRSLRPDNDYHVTTNAIVEPLGQNGVRVLAIAGCGSSAFLKNLGTNGTKCGADWKTDTGNLSAKTIDLLANPARPTGSSLPVQVVHLSPQIEGFRTPTGILDVSFGEIQEAGVLPLAQALDPGKLFDRGNQATLDLDQNTTEAIFGTHGFRIRVGPTNRPIVFDQSLANVQELSSSRELPTTYYRAASNYALLLLGDPAHKATFDDGGANPTFNPRQAVHLLAVPVLDPDQADAGAEAGVTPSAAVDGG